MSKFSIKGDSIKILKPVFDYRNREDRSMIGNAFHNLGNLQKQELAVMVLLYIL